MRKWKGPQIPRSLLHSMYEVHTEGGGYDKEQGGQWKPGTTVETAFQGVVMPLNNEDLQYIDSGSYMLIIWPSGWMQHGSEVSVRSGRRVSHGSGKCLTT